ncbi:hypothetical protein J31TS4_17840 [Paenibacillus sp. J31TS4]|uniref:hypothetical protein n=1 Tax=Paenibacillus sp. J31TS4 TaxID=2807195 RepID=UPI001B2D6A72|nr:hypothetical protein [Paenibacillus sp. J31TS4]GIP38504.1 hypothetical protein J31TS4_17840 [Paenibacillus sp. J31TS4]
MAVLKSFTCLTLALAAELWTGFSRTGSFYDRQTSIASSRLGYVLLVAASGAAAGTIVVWLARHL